MNPEHVKRNTASCVWLFNIHYMHIHCQYVLVLKLESFFEVVVYTVNISCVSERVCTYIWAYVVLVCVQACCSHLVSTSLHVNISPRNVVEYIIFSIPSFIHLLDFECPFSRKLGFIGCPTCSYLLIHCWHILFRNAKLSKHKIWFLHCRSLFMYDNVNMYLN